MIELVGKQVSRVRHRPTISTDRHRAKAVPKFALMQGPPPPHHLDRPHPLTHRLGPLVSRSTDGPTGELRLTVVAWRFIEPSRDVRGLICRLSPTRYPCLGRARAAGGDLCAHLFAVPGRGAMSDERRHPSAMAARPFDAAAGRGRAMWRRERGRARGHRRDDASTDGRSTWSMPRGPPAGLAGDRQAQPEGHRRPATTGSQVSGDASCSSTPTTRSATATSPRGRALETHPFVAAAASSTSSTHRGRRARSPFQTEALRGPASCRAAPAARSASGATWSTTASLDPSLPRAGQDLCWRLQLDGVRLAFVPDAASLPPPLDPPRHLPADAGLRLCRAPLPQYGPRACPRSLPDSLRFWGALSPPSRGPHPAGLRALRRPGRLPAGHPRRLHAARVVHL